VLAQDYAVRYPERLLGIVLTASVVAADVELGIGTRQRDYMTPAEQARVDALYTVDGRRVAPVHGDVFDEVRQREVVFNAFVNGDWKRRHLCRMSDDEIARFARYEFLHDREYYAEMIASWQAMDLRDALADLAVPTLIVDGRWDLAYAEDKPERMRRFFPRAEVVVLEEAGHSIFEDDPAGFFTALQRFVAQASTDSEATPQTAPATSPELTWAHARAAVAGVREEAAAQGWSLVTAVLDGGGYPILVDRMDGAQPASVEIALAKARAAFEFRRPTAVMQGWVRDGATHLLGLPGIVPVEGGVPIRVDGRVIGAVGVSGATAREDGVAAAAALRALAAALGSGVEGG
jgi:uncharacterized protein GlcG (DUF336 family)